MMHNILTDEEIKALQDANLKQMKQDARALEMAKWCVILSIAIPVIVIGCVYFGVFL